MPRLIDDIRATRCLKQPWWVAPHLEEIWAKHTKAISNHFLLAAQLPPVILIDNVAAYYYEGTDQEYWDLRRDFPNLAPPFEDAWFEWRMPAHIRSKECGDSDTRALTGKAPRVGVLMAATTPEHIKLVGTLPAETHWVLMLELFVDYGLGSIEGSHGSTFILVDKDGAIIERPFTQTFCARDPVIEAQVATLMGWLHAPLLAISFLHCKNVTVVSNEVPKPLAKKYHARHGVWPTRYKTLVIEPLKQILRHQGKSHEVGLAKAMHICRGHFRDYREGAGLFGKYHVVVWQDAIIRGTKRKDGGGPPPREIEIKV